MPKPGMTQGLKRTDDYVAKRIDGGNKVLTALEWKSGPNKRILDLVAPFGSGAEMREQVAALRMGG